MVTADDKYRAEHIVRIGRSCKVKRSADKGNNDMKGKSNLHSKTRDGKEV